MIKLSQKTEKIFKFLQEWQSEFHLYDLMYFHHMELFKELEIGEYYVDFDFEKYFDDKFYLFSTEGGTGEFAFWHYKDLQGEAPIVFLSSGGCEAVFLAASLNDLVCKMIHQIGFNGWYNYNEATDEDLDAMYDRVADRYFEQYNKKISDKKAKKLLEKDREEFKERALKVIDFISDKELAENLKKHPCFVDRTGQYDFKDAELHYLGHEIRNEKELQKILTIFRKEIKRGNIEKKQVIAGLKGNYPNYYTSEIVKNWLENVDKPFSEEELKANEEAMQNLRLIIDYYTLYLDGKVNTSFLKGFQEKYPKISKQEYFVDWIAYSKEKNLDAKMKQRLEDAEKDDN